MLMRRLRKADWSFLLLASEMVSRQDISVKPVCLIKVTSSVAININNLAAFPKAH